MPLLFFRKWFLLLVATACVFLGCRKNVGTSRPVRPAPSVTASAGPALTEDEYRDFGKRLEAAINACDEGASARLYRFEELAERCISDLSVPVDLREAYVSGFKKAGTSLLAARVIEDVKKGGTFTFIRVRLVDGRPRVLMRAVVPDEGLNYQELTLVRFPDGQIGVEDVFALTTGEMLSHTLRRMILKVVSESEPRLLGGFTAPERRYATHLLQIHSMQTAVREGRPHEAFAIYRKLPTELQQDKHVQLEGIRAARGINDDEYVQVLEEFRQHHPSDAVVDLISMDYFLLKLQYDQCLECIERLDKAVGGDPYLTHLRGIVFLESARYAAARAEFENAIKQEPTLEDAYWSRITVSLKEQNHADTLAWLQRIVEKMNVAIEEQNIRAAQDYADFIKSRQFGEFIEWYQSREK